MKILESLQALGLTAKEAAVYFALLAVKKGTAQSVSESAGIKRPTTYLVLESLIEKKLVAITKFRNVRDYRALPLEHLKHYVVEQKRAAEHAFPNLQKLYNARRFKVRLRVYHGLSDVKTLLEKSLRERAPMHIIGKPDEFASVLGAYWNFYIKRAAQLGIAPKFKPPISNVTLMVWSDKLALLKFNSQVRLFGLKNKQLSQMYQKLWTKY